MLKSLLRQFGLLKEEQPVKPSWHGGRYPRPYRSRPNFSFVIDRGEHRDHIIKVWSRLTHMQPDYYPPNYEIIDLECSCGKSWLNEVPCCGAVRHGRAEQGYRSLWEAVEPLHRAGWHAALMRASADQITTVQPVFR